MIEWLYSIDVALYHFFNQTLATPLGDAAWPLLTDYDKQWSVRIVLGLVWLWLMVKGGKRGRTAALLIIPLLFVTDQVSSTFIKSLVHRIRPCKAFSPSEMHLLVGCGGLSFPSSHAVNNFGVATLFSHYYPKARAYLYAWASLIAISRVFVGVHYPSDVAGGAIIGTCLALAVIWIWTAVSSRWFPSIAVEKSAV